MHRTRTTVLTAAVALLALAGAGAVALADDAPARSLQTVGAAAGQPARSGDEVRTVRPEPQRAAPAPVVAKPATTSASKPATKPAAESVPTTPPPAEEVPSPDDVYTTTVDVLEVVERDGATWLRYQGVDVLHGQEAVDAAAADGKVLDGEQYYVDRPVDDVFEIELRRSVEVVGSQRMAGSPELAPVTLQDLRREVASAPMVARLTVWGSTAKVVQEIYFA